MSGAAKTKKMLGRLEDLGILAPFVPVRAEIAVGERVCTLGERGGEGGGGELPLWSVSFWTELPPAGERAAVSGTSELRSLYILVEVEDDGDEEVAVRIFGSSLGGALKWCASGIVGGGGATEFVFTWL